MAAEAATPSSATKPNQGAIVVEWKSLGLKVDISRGKGKDKVEPVEKHILKGVSGNAQPGELLAIMGPSGAGKTSLLNCLAGRTAPTSGTTLFNGMEMQDGDRQSLAYVHQQEMLLPGVTPKEHLAFQSTLRMDGSVPRAVRQEKIAQALALLGLEKCKDQLVGDIFSGLSKSEKRRVSFATEILSDPRVLFADEPTTGLDSAMAEIIVKYMRSLAQKGRSGEPVTVMATIHQPSSEVFRLFDKLCLVLDGQVGYMGPAAELVSFLSKLNFEPPAHTPPAEFMMDVCIDPKNNEQAMRNRDAICNGWASKAGDQEVSLEQKRSVPKQQSTYKAPLLRQVAALTHRDILLLLRSRTQRVKLCVFLVFGLIFGLTYFQLEIDSTAVLTLNQAMFLSFMVCCFTEGLFACLGLPEMIPTLIREHRNGAYSPLAIYISRTLADFPFIVISSLCWSSLLYWMIGFRDDFDKFVKFAAVLLTMALSAAGIGYFAVFAVPIGALATLVVFLNILPFMLFGGLFVNFNSIPTGFMWLKEISMFRYGYAAIMLNQWEDYGPMNISDSSDSGFEDGRAVLDFFGINSWESYGVSLAAIGFVGIIYRVLALFALLKRAKPRQFDGAAPEDDTKGTLGTDEGGTASSNVPAPELSLEWHGLCVKGPGPAASAILEGCSGSIPAGNLVAIMGPSGSGKSTLLKTLANVAELPLSSGEVLVNGAPWSQDCRKFSCYLHQDETFFGNLTVREHLHFQCQLRIGRLSAQERQQRIDKWLGALGLAKCEHTLIGEIGSGISGGERKRLAFAAEVVMDPALLYVDEPTSGLDSSMARNVIQLLQDLCRGQDGGSKRTILASIHQPSAKVFAMFDKLVLLQNGRTAFFGPASEVGDHFASLGYVCPQDVSVSDFVMRRVTLSADLSDGQEQPGEVMEKLVKAVKEPARLEAGENLATAKRGDLTSSTGKQVLTLVRREGLIRRRSKLLFKAMIARALFMNLLLGLLYFQIEHDQAGVQSTMGAVTVVMINTFMTSGFGLALEIPSYIPAAIRESKQGMYSLTAWYWAKTLNDLPLDGLISSIGMTIAFWLIGFKNDAAAYFTFVLAAVALSWAGNGWGYLCAIAGGRSEFSVGMFFFSVFPMITFSGFMVVSEDIPDYFKWLESISFFRYLYSELVLTVWEDYGSIGCDAGRCPYPSGQAVLDFFGIVTGKTVRNWSILLGYVVGARLLGWGLLVWRGRNPNGALCPKRA